MKKFKKAAVVMVVLSLALTMLACGKKDTLVGTWKVSQDGVDMIYEFKEDSTGSISLGGQISINIEYKAEDDKLKITTTLLGESDEEEYAYSIKDGKLTLTKDGESLTLTKQ